MPEPSPRVERAQDPLAELQALLAAKRVVALTGAGCSTESGIPDYRGEGRPARPRSPIQHDAFVRRHETRQRYWARATIGWRSFSAAEPNRAHRGLAALERVGIVRGVITQNVDRLHQRAGSQRVIELHGALAEVVCLTCASVESRADLQDRLLAANPDWLDRVATQAPDGDAELPEAAVAAFRVPACLACAGVLKPNVVFFGGNVGAPTLEAAWSLFDEAEVLLVVGSSLEVYSGYRFVVRAGERGMAVALVNLGPTRADALARTRVGRSAGEVLAELAVRLGADRPV